MDTPEPEIISIDYPKNDTPIVVKFAYPDWKSLFKLFFVFILYNTIGAILLVVFLADAKNLATSLVKSLLIFVFYVITMLLTISYAIKKTKKTTASVFNYSLNKPQSWLIPMLIITTLALVVGLEGVSSLIPMPEYVRKVFERAFTKNIFSIITAIIAAPIMEEILCRGIVLKGLLKNYPPQKAILISAIFFGVLHLNPWQALPAFFGGLFLGWIFYKTKSVIPGMIIHATINGTAMSLLFFPGFKNGFLSALGLPYYIVLCVVSAIVFVGGCVVIKRKVLPVMN
jgi:membrane protease YdiL (CAAX protease family)